MGRRPKRSGTARIYRSLDFAPAYDLVKELDKLTDTEIVSIADRAWTEGMEIPLQYIKDWFAVIHRRTGQTAGAWVKPKTRRVNDHVIEYQYGYDAFVSPVPIFFEYGTPRIKAEFVMHYQVTNHLPVIQDKLSEELWKAVEKKMRLVQQTLDRWSR